MRGLKEIVAFARSPAGPTPPPSPDEVALRLAVGMLASGAYAENFAAAVEAAWWATAEFYRGRGVWQTTIAPLLLSGQLPDPEPALMPEEARAMHVAGFPTGAHG